MSRVSRALDRPQGKNAWLIVAVLAILLLAMAVRIHQLDGQSIWNDEGLSIYRASQSFPAIMANTITLDGVDSRDTNPPVYFLLLSLWRSTAGGSIFALRYMSVLAAVVSVAVFYQLGRRALNRPTGVIAAFLLALSPFHVWMSQEIRNYSLLLLFNLLSVYGLFRYADQQGKRGAWRWLVLWGAAGVTGIYVHFFAALVFSYGALALLWLWLRRLRQKRDWRPSRLIVAVLVVVGLVSLPILWTGFSRFRVEYQIDFVFVPLHHLISHALSAFSTGLIQTFVQPLWRVLPAILLAVVGLIAGWSYTRRRGRQASIWLILGYLLLPFLLLFLLSLISPIYNGPRHLLMALPPYLLLVAAGLAVPWSMARERDSDPQHRRSFWSRPGLWRALVTVLGLWLVISQALWLRTQFTSEALVKDDFRGLAMYLSRVAQEDDLIVLHDTISGPIFEFYYDGQAEWTAIPAFDQHDPQAALANLRSAAAEARRVWFVIEPRPRTGFPRQFLSQWTSENWPTFSSQRFPWLWLRLRLDGYVPQPVVDQLPPEATPLQANWGKELTLHGVESPDVSRAGSYWQPILYWSRQDVDPKGYHLSLRLVDEMGEIWFQKDQPLWRLFPPDEWPEGALVRHQPIIQLPAGLPPGQYQVRMRLIRDSDDQELSADDDVEIQLWPSLAVEVATYPQDEDALPANTVMNAKLAGEIEVIGYSVTGEEFKPGHAAPVEILWRVRQAPVKDYILQLQLLDEQGQVVSESSGPPSAAGYPTSSWSADEYLMGKIQLTIPATADAGMHTLRLSLLDPDSMEPVNAGLLPGSGYVTLGELIVSPWPLETEFPAIPVPYRADFGRPAAIEFHGYQLSHQDGQTADVIRPGDDLALTLFWRSLSDTLANQSVFVHLVDEQGQIIAQGDGLPVNGFRPTTSWRQGEVIVDSHLLSIPGDLASGRYALWLGFYDPETFLRMPAFVNGQPQADDRILLSEIQVSP